MEALGERKVKRNIRKKKNRKIKLKYQRKAYLEYKSKRTTDTYEKYKRVRNKTSALESRKKRIPLEIFPKDMGYDIYRKKN